MTSIDETGGEVKQTREEWLASLKTGDSAYEVSTYGGRPSLVKLTVTEKRIKVAGGIYTHYQKDRASNGSQYLIPATEDALQDYKEEINQKDYRRSIAQMIGSNLTADQLRRIEAICKEDQP